MDPDTALSHLIDCLTAGELGYAGDYFEALTDWIDAGGYPPRDPRT